MPHQEIPGGAWCGRNRRGQGRGHQRVQYPSARISLFFGSREGLLLDSDMTGETNVDE